MRYPVIYAAGQREDGSRFLLTFETKRDARNWATQNRAVISRLWAVFDGKQTQQPLLEVVAQ